MVLHLVVVSRSSILVGTMVIGSTAAPIRFSSHHGQIPSTTANGTLGTGWIPQIVIVVPTAALAMRGCQVSMLLLGWFLLGLRFGECIFVVTILFFW